MNDKIRFWVFPAILAICMVLGSCKNNTGRIQIGYLQITPDPVLDVARESLFQVLKDSGYVDGKNIDILEQNAQGDLSLIPQILQTFVSRQVDVIITNSTPCMLAAAHQVKGIPVVFTVAFGPEQVGMKEVPLNLYGVFDPFRVKEFADIVQQCIPSVRKLGVPFNTSEPNSVYSANVLTEELKKRNIEVVTTSVSGVNDIMMAGDFLVQQGCEAIIVAADNTIYLGLNTLARVADKAGIPLLVTDPMHVNKGAALGFGVDYRKWGMRSGQKVVDILKHRPIQQISPILDYELKINFEAAGRQGLTIPQDLAARAKGQE